MRRRSEIIGDAMLALEVMGENIDLRAELEELHMQEVATEAAINSAPIASTLPLYTVMLAQDITTIPPGETEANRLTRTLPAVVILRPDDESRLKGLDNAITIEDLLPKDLGMRVFGNWRIVEVQKCEAYETEIEEDETT